MRMPSRDRTPAAAAGTRASRRAWFRALLVLWVGWVFLLWGSLSLAAEVTLAWDPNSEEDLEGYGVYLSKGVPGPPYDLFGYVALADFENAAAPRFTVSGLEKGARYYFAVTAYDTEGYESYFSRPVCADVGDTIVPCPLPPASGVSGGGGSGGADGGGCFLRSSQPQPRGRAEGLFLFAVLLSLLAGIHWTWTRRSRA